MPKRCLLTGLGGFIGSHFLEHVLLNTDWEIIGIASWRHRGIPERILDSEHYQRHRSRVTVYTHDLATPVSPILRKRIGRPDIIVNFASESHVDRSIEDPVPFVKNNVDLVLWLLEFARAVQPEVFVQVGTDESYGPAEPGHDHAEWDPILPSNPYSASKAAQEAIAIAYWRTYQVPVLLTNTMNNIGERQDPEKFLPKVIKHVLEGRTMPIHAIGDRVGSRYYLHARNHADGLLFILDHVRPVPFPSAARPERFNIVGEREVDNLEMARLIARFTGKPLKYRLTNPYVDRPGHDLRYGLDGSKLGKLGWRPPIGLEASLEKTVRWYLQHREWLEFSYGNGG